MGPCPSWKEKGREGERRPQASSLLISSFNPASHPEAPQPTERSRLQIQAESLPRRGLGRTQRRGQPEGPVGVS